MGNSSGLTRRQFVQLCVASPLLVSGLSACGRARPFSLGVYQHPGHEAFYISEHFNLLPTDVMLRKSQSSEAVVNAMLSGELDAAALALDEVLTCLAAGIPLQVVLVLARSCGANALLSRPEFHNASQLKGKVIALESRPATELLLEHYLHKSGLERNDVEVAYLPQLKQLMAWQESQIDAVINTPPVSHYIERAGAVRLFDSSQCPPLMFQVLAVRTDRIGWLSNIPARLLNSYYLGLQQIRLFSGDSFRRTALWRNLTLSETTRYFASVQYPSPMQNMTLLSDSKLMSDAMQKLSSFMPAPGSAALDFTHVFNATALRQLVLNS